MYSFTINVREYGIKPKTNTIVNIIIKIPQPTKLTTREKSARTPNFSDQRSLARRTLTHVRYVYVYVERTSQVVSAQLRTETSVISNATVQERFSDASMSASTATHAH